MEAAQSQAIVGDEHSWGGCSWNPVMCKVHLRAWREVGKLRSFSNIERVKHVHQSSVGCKGRTEIEMSPKIFDWKDREDRDPHVSAGERV